MSIKAIVTDIEGTTTDIAFVHQVLFPYAAEHIADFIQHNWHDQTVRSLCHEVAQLATCDADDQQAIIQQCLDWIAQDQKVTPLKSLQGLLWHNGYQQGDFRGHVYPDVAPKLAEWQAQGIALYVYSSGSVTAQKLLFGYSDAGDLTPLFAGYFDTHVGHKQQTQSYHNIQQQIGLPSAELLFLSDIEAELDAAREAGWHTYHLQRGQTVDSNHPVAQNFNEIAL